MKPATRGAAAPARVRTAGVLGAVAVLALAVFAYEPAFRAGWIWDDDLYVTDNRMVQGGLEGLRDIWLGFYRNPQKQNALVVKTYQYYPLLYSSFWLDHKLFGLDPAGYHVLNVLLHLANAALVLVLARRLAIPGAPLVAALFALHPMMVESVAWVSERKNLLSGFFYLAAFLAWLRFDDGRRAGWLAASVALFVGALLSKTVTATLPAALLLAVVWRRGRVQARDVVPLAPFVALGVGLGWFAVHLEQYAVGATRPEFGQTALERWVLIAPRAFAFYASKALWPQPVAFIYPRFEPDAADALAYLWLVGDAAVVVALFLARRAIGLGPLLLVLYSALTLAPALGFVPVFPHRYSWVADHFAYLGLLGFFALLASAGARAVARIGAPAPAVVAASAVLLVACAALSRDAARSYHDEETLWRDTLAKSPDAWIAMINLGADYMTKPPGSAERTAAAIELFRRAEQYPLGRVQALTNQGIWHRRQGDLERAADAFRRALALEPGRVKTRQYLTELHVMRVRRLLSEGRHQEAVTACVTGLGELGDPRLAAVCDSLAE